MMPPNGIVGVQTLDSGDLLRFWNLTDSDSVNGLTALLSSEDVRAYFAVKWLAGAQQSQTLDDHWRPFLAVE
jgi:hypothetical protein